MPWTLWVSVIAALMLGLNLGVVLMGILVAGGRDCGTYPATEREGTAASDRG